MIGLIFGFVFLGVLCILALDSFVMVSQQHVVIIQRLGKFHKTMDAGWNWKIPIFDRAAGTMSLRITELNVEVETKTKDNVFVKTRVSVQFKIKSEDVETAFYKLDNLGGQIESYVFDTVRSEIPKLNLDNVFEEKDTIAEAIKKELSETMVKFGIQIVQSLITDVDPDHEVKEAMNEINKAKRLKEAAVENAAALKITIIAKAEAESESKRLQGEGVAAQRKAIADGIKESIDTVKGSVEGASSQEIMDLIMLTQKIDMMEKVGANSRSNVVFLDTSTSSSKDDMRTALLEANAANLGGATTQVVPSAATKGAKKAPTQHNGGDLS